MLKENYKKVRAAIDEACEKCGRKKEEVLLIAVSKTKPLSDIEELITIQGHLKQVMNYGANIKELLLIAT